jgi:hypothetical protein
MHELQVWEARDLLAEKKAGLSAGAAIALEPFSGLCLLALHTQLRLHKNLQLSPRNRSKPFQERPNFAPNPLAGFSL